MKFKFKFSYLMLLVALSVAGTAGYFSVWGLSQLFAGASTSVIIMASILELGKVVTTTALHRYWSKLAKTLKIYLTISVAVLMLITSAGIYGFLSNAYQKTANKLEIHEGELGVLSGKKMLFEKNISDNEKIVQTKNKRIDQLTNLRTNQENRLDSAKTNKAKDKVRNDIQLATNEIQKLSSDIDGLNAKNAILSDSVSKYNVKALELKAGSEVAGEVGPLKYIAELTGAPMGKVVNYLILLLIFVFDPLAIALILMTNRVFQLQGETNPLELKNNAPKEILKAPIDGINDGANDGANDAVLPDEQHEDEYEEVIPTSQVTEDSVPMSPAVEEIKEPITEEVKEPIVEEVQPPVVEETKLVSEQQIEVPVYKKEPVIPTGKIAVEDIKEIKENRGYSVQVPQPKSSNTIERIGSNKVVKNGDNNKVYFKRKQ